MRILTLYMNDIIVTHCIPQAQVGAHGSRAGDFIVSRLLLEQDSRGEWKRGLNKVGQARGLRPENAGFGTRFPVQGSVYPRTCV